MANRRLLGAVAIVVPGLALPAAALALTLRTDSRHARTKAIATATATATTPAMPVSQATDGVRAIGALYPSGSDQHDCTAAVVESAAEDTLITAAHCISGTGRGMIFEPGEHGGQAPYGIWTVTAAYPSGNWIVSQDPDDDIAFLTVAPRQIDGRRTEIQQATGGYRLGTTARSGQRATITGYPAGTDNDPITCAVTVYRTREFPSFDCRGYVAGTSGTPWLHATERGLEIIGVIGGRNQGGCHDYTSYSSPMTAGVLTAYQRAAAGARSHVVPSAGSDGC
jgi:V8-like Glu-specific endopeptidase